MYNVWQIVLIDCLLSFLLQKYSPLVGSYIKKEREGQQNNYQRRFSAELERHPLEVGIGGTFHDDLADVR